MVCRSCGDTHPPAAAFCPRTGEPARTGPCGTQIDRYEVTSLLGGGGMGAVYRARHVMLNQPVALKLLKAGLAAHPDMLERFVREAQAAAAIGSPHIVRVSDVGISSEGQAFIAMELLEGEDLDHLLHAQGALPVRRAVDLTKQILAGLGAAHAAGIVHRDLKPANVFLVGDVLKLLDFGVSKVRTAAGEVSSLTRTGVVMGTPQFMAPEQFRAARDVDHRADLYSTAVTLYQMLAGTVPFDATTYETLILQVCTEDAKPLRVIAPHVPGPIARVVERGMARDPKDRWQSAADFSRALDAATADVVGALTPALAKTMLAPSTPGSGSGTGVVTPPTPRRRPSWILGAGAVVALGGAGAAGWLLSRGAASPEVTTASIAAPSVAGEPPAEAAPDARLAAVIVAQTPPASPVDAAPSAGEVGPDDRTPSDSAASPDAGLAAPSKKSPKSPRKTPTPSGIVVGEPRIVGDLSGAPLRQAFGRASADLEECRPRGTRTEKVEVQFHVHTTIHLAAAAPDNTGDADVARCVANRVKEQAPKWPEGTSGILVVVVTLPPR